MPAQLDQQQKHSTSFVDSFTNPTGESGEVTGTGRRLGLHLNPHGTARLALNLKAAIRKL